MIRHGVIPASRGGKAKTLLQMLAIAAVPAAAARLAGSSARTGVLAVALVLTVVTGVDYVARANRLRRAGP